MCFEVLLNQMFVSNDDSIRLIFSKKTVLFLGPVTAKNACTDVRTLHITSVDSVITTLISSRPLRSLDCWDCQEKYINKALFKAMESFNSSWGMFLNIDVRMDSVMILLIYMIFVDSLIDATP